MCTKLKDVIGNIWYEIQVRNGKSIIVWYKKGRGGIVQHMFIWWALNHPWRKFYQHQELETQSVHVDSTSSICLDRRLRVKRKDWILNIIIVKVVTRLELTWRHVLAAALGATWNRLHQRCSRGCFCTCSKMIGLALMMDLCDEMNSTCSNSCVSKWMRMNDMYKEEEGRIEKPRIECLRSAVI